MEIFFKKVIVFLFVLFKEGIVFLFLLSSAAEYVQKPNIHIIPLGVTYPFSTVTIECNSSVNRLSGCGFYKDSSFLDYQSRSSTTSGIQYIISQATIQEDEGLYYCICDTIENRRTESSSHLPLILRGYLQKPDICIIPLGVNYLHSKVTIECKSSVYTLSRCWFCKDSSHQCYQSRSSTTSGIQYFISKAIIQDEGLYYCICDTIENQRTECSSHVPLILTASLGKPHIRAIPPGITSVGSSVTIECSSDYRLFGCWFYKNHGWLLGYVNSNSTSVIPYFIQSVTAEDAGNYSCNCYGEYNNYTETSLPFPLILTGSNSSLVIIAMVCSAGFLALLGVARWIYTSRRNKINEEKVTGMQTSDHRSPDTLPADAIYENVTDGNISSGNNNPEPHDSSVTYHLLNFAAEKDFVRADIPDQFVEYTTVTKTPKR